MEAKPQALPFDAATVPGLSEGVPLLALDMYEHAYHMDYGASAAAYVDAFMATIDWQAVYGRYQAAVHGASEALACGADEIGDAQLIDVRRPASSIPRRP